MQRFTLLAILLVGPLAGNAQAKNWFSALMHSPSDIHHTAGPALIQDSQPELATHTYMDSRSRPISHSYGHHGYADGAHGCTSCGSDYSDLWAGYCSRKRGHCFSRHRAKCCKPACGTPSRHVSKCHRPRCCGMGHFKAKCHSCWGHLAHWFKKSCHCNKCSSGCSNCDSHDAGHYDGEILEGEVIPTPMEDASPSDRPVAERSAVFNLIPKSLKIWPISFGR